MPDVYPLELGQYSDPICAGLAFPTEIAILHIDVKTYRKIVCYDKANSVCAESLKMVSLIWTNQSHTSEFNAKRFPPRPAPSITHIDSVAARVCHTGEYCWCSEKITFSESAPKYMKVDSLSSVRRKFEWALGVVRISWIMMNGQSLSTWVRALLRLLHHWNDVIMSAMASQITSLAIVYSAVYSRRRSKKAPKLRVTDPFGVVSWIMHILLDISAFQGKLPALAT